MEYYQVPTTDTNEPHYIQSKELGKYVRTLLKQAFPAHKFSVTADRSTGSIDVILTDETLTTEAWATLRKEVTDAVGFLHGEGFDGSIDMRYSRKHYLLPSGEIIYAGTEGTKGSRGYVAAVHIPKPEHAKQLRLCSSFIRIARY